MKASIFKKAILWSLLVWIIFVIDSISSLCGSSCTWFIEYDDGGRPNHRHRSNMSRVADG